MAPKNVTLRNIAELIEAGQNHAKERLDDLKEDLSAKHKENVDRRHDLVNRYSELEGRVTIVETKLTSIVGDNSGGSGLLHEIDRKVDALTGEIAGIKKTVEDTPKINKWVYGAIAVIGFLVVVVPIVFGLLFELARILTRH